MKEKMRKITHSSTIVTEKDTALHIYEHAVWGVERKIDMKSLRGGQRERSQKGIWRVCDSSSVDIHTDI